MSVFDPLGINVLTGRMNRWKIGDSFSGVELTVVKKENEARTNNILANDAHLSFTLAANEKYYFSGVVFFDTVAAADFKFRFLGPVSPALVRISRWIIVPGTGAFAGVAVETGYSTSDLPVTGSGSIGGCMEFEGTIHNGPNSGDFNFAWAQNTTNASPTTVYAGSCIRWIKL